MYVCICVCIYIYPSTYIYIYTKTRYRVHLMNTHHHWRPTPTGALRGAWQPRAGMGIARGDGWSGGRPNRASAQLQRRWEQWRDAYTVRGMGVLAAHSATASHHGDPCGRSRPMMAYMCAAHDYLCPMVGGATLARTITQRCTAVLPAHGPPNSSRPCGEFRKHSFL